MFGGVALWRQGKLHMQVSLYKGDPLAPVSDLVKLTFRLVL